MMMISFFPRDTTHRAAYAVVWCTSVFVTFAYSIEMSKHYDQTFSPSGRPTTPAFPYQTLWQYSIGTSPTGASNRFAVLKISWFSTNISFYLGNDTRQGHSYYGTPIGTRMRSIELFQMTLSDLQPRFQGHYITQRPITHRLIKMRI